MNYFLQLIKYTPDDDDDNEKLRRSSKLSIELIKKINDEVGKKDDLERLEWLDEHIPNAKNYV